MDKPLLTTLTRRAHLMMRRRIYADVRAAGFADLTPAHLYVFQQPGPDGLRPTDLAVRMNMTKQATNHLLSGLEARGYIQRVPAPEDGRGKVLRLTGRGRQVVDLMQESSRRLEAEWSKHVGNRALEQLRQQLVELTTIGDE
jgi:DNA-binding MarR family transcriptional regulator